MKTLCVAFTAMILLILAFITFYLLAKGFSHLSWDIFTRAPIPVGMEGAPFLDTAGRMVGLVTLNYSPHRFLGNAIAQ